jgi:hypothetical protein
MSREISRRLAALEHDRGGDRIRYVVSDRPLTDDEWQASKNDGADLVDDVHGLGPLLTETEWIARFCF